MQIKVEGSDEGDWYQRVQKWKNSQKRWLVLAANAFGNTMNAGQEETHQEQFPVEAHRVVLSKTHEGKQSANLRK